VNVLTARKKRGIVFINIAIFAVGVFTCLLLYLVKGNADFLSSALCLFVGLQIASITVSVCLCIKIDKNWHFDTIGLVEQSLIRKDKLIRYSDIKAITICSAVNSRFFPICDEHGVSKAVIVIYDNWCVARSQMRPDAIFVLPATPSLGSLSCSFFTDEKLKILMDRTNATVFISKKEYERNRDQLGDIFGSKENEVLIAVSNDAVQGRFVAFDPQNHS
jgi:hypothetical protein